MAAVELVHRELLAYHLLLLDLAHDPLLEHGTWPRRHPLFPHVQRLLSDPVI